MQKEIFKSEYFRITQKEDGFYIETFQKGVSLESFNKVIMSHPEIEITSIIAVRNALVNAPMPPVKFAQAKQKVEVEISEDELRAYITLNASEEELSGDKRADLFKEIVQKLKDENVTFGIKNKVLLSKMRNGEKILVAEGIPPVRGKAAVITMYNLKEARPSAKEDGNVNHYELNLINRVVAGDWLGEKIHPTSGTPGKSVKGRPLQPVPGQDLPLMYDRKTVKEVDDGQMTVLYAAIDGAVHYTADRISVSNHLEVDGDIDYKTGNIDFDGYLTVKGTIEDGFSIKARKDIEILGDYGVGGVKEIVSEEGSIYIKGGVAGKNKAIIRSKGNIYTKFASDVTIECGGTLHIGFYCLNSTIKAKEVILDSLKGQIIGGAVNADVRVVSALIGSAAEMRTIVSVSGFNRNALQSSLMKVTDQIEKLKDELKYLKYEALVYSNVSGLTKEQKKGYEKINDKLFKVQDKIKELEFERKALSGYLKARGEGEISVLKRVYPNTQLIIKQFTKEITSPVLSTSYFVQDGELKEI
jgi:uncharacterized protein (DUF342 family)